jgi:hypothetical protein
MLAFNNPPDFKSGYFQFRVPLAARTKLARGEQEYAKRENICPDIYILSEYVFVAPRSISPSAPAGRVPGVRSCLPAPALARPQKLDKYGKRANVKFSPLNPLISLKTAKEIFGKT